MNKSNINKTNQFHYVYILKSVNETDHFYIGLTEDLNQRLKKHNKGDCSHTSKHKLWQIETTIAFTTQTKAANFEKYLKSHSGRAFAKKHF